MEILKPGEKVYVAIGADLQEGFATLKWTLKKWSSDSTTIVILYADNSIRKDYVYTPIGKLPASSLNEEKLEVLEKHEEAKTEIIVSKYVAFCQKAKTEVVKMGKYDGTLPKVLVELITDHGMTKLVMALSFLKLSSWKSKIAVSASFYVQRQKPDFCDLFVICGGKLVFLREENNEGFVEDDQGVRVAKLRERKAGFKGWLGKMFNENGFKKVLDDPSSSARKDHWGKLNEGMDHFFNPLFASSKKEQNFAVSNGTAIVDLQELHIAELWVCNEEIEDYFNQLSSSTAEEGDLLVANGAADFDVSELHVPDDLENNDGTREIDALKIRIQQLEEAIQSSRKEAMMNRERSAKARWALEFCTKKAEELEACKYQENAKTMGLHKQLDNKKEELLELQSEVEERKSKLKSVLEIQKELSNKLRLSSAAKSRIEVQLEKSVHKRAERVQEIENLRRQRDVLQRRIEFCKEKDAIGMANKLEGFGFDCMKFTAEDIKVATNDFSESLRLKSEGKFSNVYRGRINKTTVAIKLVESPDALSEEAFHNKVKLLTSIRHPHILGIIGFCTEPKCIVYENMHNGCLRDALFSNPRSTKAGYQSLSWHARIRVASEVWTVLSFLHKAKPWPISRSNLHPSKILLDRNNVAKIYELNPSLTKDECDISSDIRAFGYLLLQLLTGSDVAGLAGEAIIKDDAMLVETLDKTTGEWPQDLAMEVGRIAKSCLSTNQSMERGFNSKLLTRRINKVRRKADERVASGDSAEADEDDINIQDSSNVPSIFLCPIFKDVMKNPHVAADGFSYELEAIEEWLQTCHDTSPMTNLKLKNKNLTPNHTLRSLIQDWHNKISIHYTIDST